MENKNVNRINHYKSKRIDFKLIETWTKRIKTANSQNENVENGLAQS